MSTETDRELLERLDEAMNPETGGMLIKDRGIECIRAYPRLRELARKGVEAEEGLKCAHRAIESDRTALFQFIHALDAEITGRMWLIEGRGAYEWDDDQYRKEFGWAIEAIQGKLEPLRKIAADLKNTPKTSDEVIQARRNLEAQLATAQARIAELEQDKERLDWLESEDYFIIGTEGETGAESKGVEYESMKAGMFILKPTVRLAIDAAQQKEQG